MFWTTIYFQQVVPRRLIIGLMFFFSYNTHQFLSSRINCPRRLVLDRYQRIIVLKGCLKPTFIYSFCQNIMLAFFPFCTSLYGRLDVVQIIERTDTIQGNMCKVSERGRDLNPWLPVWNRSGVNAQTKWAMNSPAFYFSCSGCLKISKIKL